MEIDEAVRIVVDYYLNEEVDTMFVNELLWENDGIARDESDEFVLEVQKWSQEALNTIYARWKKENN